MSGAEAARQAFFAVPVAWLAGAIGLGTFAMVPLFPLAAISFLLIGLLIATDLRLKAGAIMMISGGVGCLHGWLDGAAMRAEGGGWLAAVGGCLTATVLVLLAAGLVLSLKPAWTRIAVRVAGSWVAATGLLMTGWWLHLHR